VAGIQMSCDADKEINFAKAISGIREAAAKGAQLFAHRIIYLTLFL